jgi:hypothetical protein
MSKTCHECEKNRFVLPYEYFANPLTIVEEGGDWIQGAIKHPGRCTPGSPNYDCPKGSPQWNLAQRFKHGDLHKAQQGGDQQQQIMQIIAMYAKLHNTQPQMIIQKLQQLDESQQQQALQSMVAELQQGGGAQQQSAPTSYAANDEFSEMGDTPQFVSGGTNSYSQTGGAGYRGAAGGVGGVPYIAPALQTSIGDSKFLGPLKAVTGYMGLAAGLGAGALGLTKSAQWVGNKVLPDGGLKDGFNGVMDTANNAFKGIVDFGVTAGGISTNGQNSANRQAAANRKQPVTFPTQNPVVKGAAVQKADSTKIPYNPEDEGYKPDMIDKYGRYLPKHQAGTASTGSSGGPGGSTGGTGTGDGSAGMMMNDGSTDYNEGYFQAYKQDDKAYNADPNQCAPGSECDKAKKQQQQQPQQPGKKKAAPAAGGSEGEKPFNGMEYAQKGLMGLGAFRDYKTWQNDQKERDEYEKMLERVGNTDFRLASNSPNPFGDYTLNVGPANNFQLGMTTPVQDSGTYGRYGGSFKYGGQSYKEGGEYQVSEDELLQLMQNGAEIEFINK